MIYSLFIVFFLFAHTAALHAFSSKYAIVINGYTGQVLFEKNADCILHPASTTKIATTYLALTTASLPLNQKITVPLEALRTLSKAERARNNFTKYPSYYLQTDGTSAGLKADEVVTFEDLLCMTLLQSANDAANVLAGIMCNGSIEKFEEVMAAFLQNIGCTKTRFINPHGLHHPHHVTTPRELAIIAKTAMTHPTFRTIAAKTEYHVPETNKQPARFYVQKNKLQKKQSAHYYPHAIGIKIGYTDHARCNLVAAAQKNDRFLISVIMHGNKFSDVFDDTIHLFKRFFSEKKVKKTLFKAGPQKFTHTIKHGSSPIMTYTAHPVVITYYPSEAPKIRTKISFKDNLTYPIQQGAEVGILELYYNDQLISKVPLFSQNQVDIQLFLSLYEKFIVLVKQPLFLFLVAFSLFTLIFFTRKSRPR